jgi:mRNA interferase MazF
MSIAPTPKRGEVWLIDFDPAVGAEIQKIRPAVVISLDSIGRLALRIVVPITDWKSHYASWPWFVELAPTSLNGLHKFSGADAFQTKSISEHRFVRKLGEVYGQQLDAIADAIAVCVGVP